MYNIKLTIGISSLTRYYVIIKCYSNIPSSKATPNTHSDLWKIEIAYFLSLSLTFEDKGCSARCTADVRMAYSCHD